jgi:hypothetical protein
MAGLDQHRAAVEAALGPRLRGVRWDQWAGRHEVERFRKEVLPTLDGELAMSLLIVLAEMATAYRGWSWEGIRVLGALGRRVLPWTGEDAALVLTMALKTNDRTALSVFRASFSAVEQLDPGGRAQCLAQLRAATAYIDGLSLPSGDRSTLRARLRALLLADEPATPQSRVDTDMIHTDDGWGPFAVGRLTGVVDDPGAITNLLEHAAGIPSGPRPTQAWLKRAVGLLDGVGSAPGLVHDLLIGAATCEPAPVRIDGYDQRVRVGPVNVDLVKGLLWTALLVGEARLVPAAVAVIASRPTPDQRLLNACFAVLGRRGDAEAIAALVRVQRAARDRGKVKQITAALAEAAKRSGISRSELTEQTVPDGGLDAAGERRLGVADAIAVLALDPVGRVSADWEFGGTRATRVPPHLTADHGSEVAQVKRAAAELRNLVAGERDRLEDLLVEEREWPLDVWRDRYLRHPITGRLASRLLWTMVTPDRTRVVLPTDGGDFRLADGTTVVPAADARIRCWHPVRAEPAEVRAWRDVIMEHELKQPFKQAFREVYLLTPAERVTGVYSNRFAAHVLRYPQTYALMKERRWGSNYLGGWDGGYSGEATRDFEAYGLRAVFYHEQVDADNASQVDYCTTDQVRFERIGDRSRTAVPLTEVPRTVFSEAMRDVDLFVGVTSIATDPTWNDHGRDRHVDYWRRVAFGDLTASGQTRKEVIERLLPRLKIRDRARVEGLYLVVEGRRHTYRIHVGSGNILMSPNDQYLCIVPARSTAPGAVRFVPFEGDALLSVVLSKALMLADDHRITDPSILAQIN